MPQPAPVTHDAPPDAVPDYAGIKTKQRAAWSAGDYSAVGVTLQIVGEQLCERLDVRAGERVLDVAAGNGNASLAAARRLCEVTSTDYVGALLERGRARAAAEGLAIEFREADAEALPFADASFDVVVSTFGVMFAPDQERAASELFRVCRPGGRIGLANWTTESFIGVLFRTLGNHVAPPPRLRPPALWGTGTRLRELFPAARDIAIEERVFALRYRSPAHWADTWRAVYGPIQKAFDAVGPDGHDRLRADLVALAGRFNTATDGTLVVPSVYAEVVITR